MLGYVGYFFFVQINRISDSSCKKSSLRSSMSQVEAELQLPLVRNSQSQGSAALRHIANCPGNVRWRRLRTDGRLLDTLTEPSSLWTMSPLSSPCRMETAPGFSPWGLVMPHCGTSCLVLNFPITSFSQHISTPFCPSRALQRMMSRCMVQDQQAQQALSSNKTDSWWSSGEQSWMRMALLRTCYYADKSDFT